MQTRPLPPNRSLLGGLASALAAAAAAVDPRAHQPRGHYYDPATSPMPANPFKRLRRGRPVAPRGDGYDAARMERAAEKRRRRAQRVQGRTP